MIYIESGSLNSYYNLALEEYILRNFDIKEDIVFLWRNTPTIVVGNNQNTIEEINMPFVNEKQIKVVRRLSGGGAVYQDPGNLNFTFLVSLEKPENTDIKKFAQPVAAALNKLGAPAELTGRNDITIEDKKISGNAQRLFQNKLLHHGTLLFDVNLEDMVNSLQVSFDKIQSKGIKSVRSRVTNIKPYLKKEMDITGFRDAVLKELFQGNEVKQHFLSVHDKEMVNKLVEEKYSTWDWNFGFSPPYTIKDSRRFPAGKVEFFLDIEKGKIKNCQIYGDFLALRDVIEIEKALQGKPYRENDIREALSKFDLSYYFGNISLEEIMTVFSDS